MTLSLFFKVKILIMVHPVLMSTHLVGSLLSLRQLRLVIGSSPSRVVIRLKHTTVTGESLVLGIDVHKLCNKRLNHAKQIPRALYKGHSVLVQSTALCLGPSALLHCLKKQSVSECKAVCKAQCQYTG